MITWSLGARTSRLTAFNSCAARGAGASRKTAVAHGDYDFYVDKWARAAAKFRRPILLRFGHEMNDPYRYPWGPQNNTKEEYIAAWRHVVERFRKNNANAVVWVWSPHVAYQYWETYYPGSDYVDWVATGALNYGPSLGGRSGGTFQEIFGNNIRSSQRSASQS